MIDVQREYFDGALPISHPAGHLENILSVMDAAAKSKVPTAVIPAPPTRSGLADFSSPFGRLAAPQRG